MDQEAEAEQLRIQASDVVAQLSGFQELAKTEADATAAAYEVDALALKVSRKSSRGVPGARDLRSIPAWPLALKCHRGRKSRHEGRDLALRVLMISFCSPRIKYVHEYDAKAATLKRPLH